MPKEAEDRGLAAHKLFPIQVSLKFRLPAELLGANACATSPTCGKLADRASSPASSKVARLNHVHDAPS
jgi:hypothetical protein